MHTARDDVGLRHVHAGHAPYRKALIAWCSLVLVLDMPRRYVPELLTLKLPEIMVALGLCGTAGAFLAACRRYVPDLTSGDLLPGPSGVRAQALGPDGQLVDDFVVEVQGRRILHVRNAPSPAATSSLALAKLIADQAEQAGV